MEQPTPQDMDALERVVLSGQKLMYDPKTFPMLKDGLMREGPMPSKLSVQAAGIIKLLDDRAQGGIPKQVIIPAATALLFEMVDLVKQAGLAELSEEDVKKAMSLLVQIILKEYGVLDKLQGSAQSAQPPAQPQPGLMAQGA